MLGCHGWEMTTAVAGLQEPGSEGLNPSFWTTCYLSLSTTAHAEKKPISL